MLGLPHHDVFIVLRQLSNILLSHTLTDETRMISVDEASKVLDGCGSFTASIGVLYEDTGRGRVYLLTATKYILILTNGFSALSNG